ncbi:MAG TPA: hypothetical protein VGO52_19880 [Hyphomonadaceae bacterium]|jgi:hypothetical protein|nr:hypothetical protein [Hyphomonadaceae bacterium]
MRSGFARLILPVFLAIMLAACGGGGGGGGGGSTGNRAPTAVAGAGVTGVVGELLTFNGAASSDPDGNTIAYVWAITSAPSGSAAVLSSATTPTPKLRPDVSGTYVLSLVVTDGTLVSAASTTTATVTLDAANQSQQNASRVTATTAVQTQTTLLNWADGFPSGTTYRIERLNNSVFSEIETIVGLGGTTAPMQWSRPYTGPVTYRVMALTGGREIPLVTPTGNATMSVTLSAPMDIQLTASEPVFGTVQASVNNAPAGSTVAWFQNLTSIGAGNPVNWITSTLPNGPRLLQAIVNMGDGTFVDLRRTVAVLNTPLAASFTQSLTLNQLEVIVDASSSAGISSVQVKADTGGGTQTLTAPNHCVSCTPGAPNRYRFVFTLTGPSGNIFVDVVDGGGAERHLSGTFSLAPVTLTLATPHAGAFLFGTLNVSGTTSSQPGNAVTTTAALGDVTFLNTTASNFSGAFSLAGIPPGSYTLTVRATGANGFQVSKQRQVFVTSSAAFAYQPMFTVSALNPSQDLLGLDIRDADDSTVLYRATFANSSPLFTYRVTPNAHAALATTSGGAPMALWQNSVFGQVNGAGINPPDAACTTAGRCIYTWSTLTGAATNFSDPAGVPVPATFGTSTPVVKVRGDYLLWDHVPAGVSSRDIVVYNLSMNTFQIIGPTTAPVTPENNVTGNADLAVVGGRWRCSCGRVLQDFPPHPVAGNALRALQVDCSGRGGEAG